MSVWWLVLAFWSGGALVTLSMLSERRTWPRRVVTFVVCWPWSICWYAWRRRL